MSLKIIFSSNCVEIDCVTGIGGSEWWLGRNLFIYSCSIDNYFVTKVKYIDSVNTYSCGPSEAIYFILILAICVIVELRFLRLSLRFADRPIGRCSVPCTSTVILFIGGTKYPHFSWKTTWNDTFMLRYFSLPDAVDNCSYPESSTGHA